MTLLDKGPQYAAFIGVFLGLATVFFSMRMYVKTFITKGWGVDDLLLIVSFIFFVTYCTSAALGVKYGTGRHVSNIPPQDIPKALYCWFLCELFYTLTTVFIRASISVFLIRICVKRVLKVIIYTTMAVVVVFSTIYFFIVLFQCSPVDYFWNVYRGAHGTCINPTIVPNASIAHSVVSFSADWVLGLLPIAMIWKLQMNRRTKWSLGAILAVGLLAGIATMIRIPFIKFLSITDDFLYATTNVAICSTVEASLGIVAASAYTLRPLFRSFYSDSSRGHPGSSNSKGAYMKKQSSRRSQTGEPARSNQDIPLFGIDSAPAGKLTVATTRSPFGDSNEDLGHNHDALGTLEDEHGRGIQVRRTFEISRAAEDGPLVPWQRPENSSSATSIV